MNLQGILNLIYVEALIVLMFVLPVYLIFRLYKKDKAKRKNDAATIKSRANSIQEFLVKNNIYSPTVKVVGLENSYIFATDDAQRKILYHDTLSGKSLLLDYKDLISCEKASNSTSYSDRASYFGYTRAQYEQYTYIAVRILMKEGSSKAIEIPCFSTSRMLGDQSAVKSYDQTCKQALADAQQILNALNVICANKKEETKSVTSNDVFSVADELTKLAALREKGILSEEEYILQKKRLLETGA